MEDKEAVKKSVMVVSTDWREVGNIIDQIMHSLNFVDFICFSATCKFWKQESELHRYVCSSCPKAHNPWLLLTCDYNFIRNYESIKNLCFYDISNGRYYSIPTKVATFAVVGCSNGFIITVDEDFELHILNPVSGTYYYIESETISTLLCVYYNYFGLLGIAKISAHPLTSKPDWIVLTIGPRIMCRSIEMDDWIEMKLYPNYDYEMESDDEGCYEMHYKEEYDEHIIDVAFHKGRLHIVKYSGSYVFDLSSKSREHEPAELMGHVKTRKSYHLVESSNHDDLYLVVRSEDFETREFMVYKLDESRGEWNAIHVLEDLALFVGPSSLLYKSINVPGNSICYVNEKRGRNIEMFDISEGTVVPLKLNGVPIPENYRQLWFTPSHV